VAASIEKVLHVAPLYGQGELCSSIFFS